jgi:hypothetical protein
MAFRVLATNVNKRGMIEQEVVESTQKTMNSPPTHPRPRMQGRNHEDGSHTDHVDRISGFRAKETSTELYQYLVLRPICPLLACWIRVRAG